MSVEAQIRRIVEDQSAAWNAGDARRYASHFAKDGSFTNVYGMTMYGHAEFEKRHTEIFATFFRGSTLEAIIRRIHPLTSNVVLADIEATVTGAGRMPPGVAVTPAGVLHTRLLQVFVERDGRWWIEAHHNVDVK
ncbi:MAG: SgcJ/EcaC family oxidoreductase [Gammaproteobacteria bacterium]|nr:SgcJ/EcaC family oxidoreductase [Gammaproteobacteria bacterium]